MDEPSESEARLTRIEALQEANARDIAGLIASQRNHASDITELYKITGEIAEGGKALLIAQQKVDDSLTKLADAQRKTEESMHALSIKSAETQGKLDALIHMWDDWIRDRGGIQGAPGPAM